MAIIYTPQVVEKIRQAYLASPTTETCSTLAAELGVPPRSVIAKLSSLGVYQKRGYLTKQGEPPVRKGVYIDQIAAALGMPPELCESLEKVNKNVLVAIAGRLK